jgi:acetyl esterase/lipase
MLWTTRGKLTLLSAMKLFALSAALAAFVGFSATAQDRPVITLWPSGVPGPEAKLEPEKDMTKDSDNNVGGKRLIRLGNVSNPTLTLYRPPADKATGAAVLVCPGGGYHILAMDLEGTEVCERLNEIGVTAALLKYRVPKRENVERWAPPLQDAQRALGLMRQNAGKWGIDSKRIGVLGFSAGGNLAAILSSQYAKRTYPNIDASDETSCRPDFTILIYPAYLTVENDPTRLIPELKVTENTPQAFVVMAQDDPVRAENALGYTLALAKQKIPCELHLYPTGGHGYGLRKTAEPVTTWPDRLQDWFTSRGLLKK